MEYGNSIPDFFIDWPNGAGESFCSVGHDLLNVVAGVPSLLERAKKEIGVGQEGTPIMCPVVQLQVREQSPRRPAVALEALMQIIRDAHRLDEKLIFFLGLPAVHSGNATNFDSWAAQGAAFMLACRIVLFRLVVACVSHLQSRDSRDSDSIEAPGARESLSAELHRTKGHALDVQRSCVETICRVFAGSLSLQNEVSKPACPIQTSLLSPPAKCSSVASFLSSWSMHVVLQATSPASLTDQQRAWLLSVADHITAETGFKYLKIFATGTYELLNHLDVTVDSDPKSLG